MATYRNTSQHSIMTNTNDERDAKNEKKGKLTLHARLVTPLEPANKGPQHEPLGGERG